MRLRIRLRLSEKGEVDCECAGDCEGEGDCE